MFLVAWLRDSVRRFHWWECSCCVFCLLNIDHRCSFIDVFDCHYFVFLVDQWCTCFVSVIEQVLNGSILKFFNFFYFPFIRATPCDDAALKYALNIAKNKVLFIFIGMEWLILLKIPAIGCRIVLHWYGCQDIYKRILVWFFFYFCPFWLTQWIWISYITPAFQNDISDQSFLSSRSSLNNCR